MTYVSIVYFKYIYKKDQLDWNWYDKMTGGSKSKPPAENIQCWWDVMHTKYIRVLSTFYAAGSFFFSREKKFGQNTSLQCFIVRPIKQYIKRATAKYSDKQTVFPIESINMRFIVAVLFCVVVISKSLLILRLLWLKVHFFFIFNIY